MKKLAILTICFGFIGCAGQSGGFFSFKLYVHMLDRGVIATDSIEDDGLTLKYRVRLRNKNKFSIPIIYKCFPRLNKKKAGKFKSYVIELSPFGVRNFYLGEYKKVPGFDLHCTILESASILRDTRGRILCSKKTGILKRINGERMSVKDCMKTVKEAR